MPMATDPRLVVAFGGILRCGSVNVLGGAPFGYRYVPKTADSGASYEVADHEAVIAAGLFRRYTDDGASIADLTRWLTTENVPTRTGKAAASRSAPTTSTRLSGITSPPCSPTRH